MATSKENLDAQTELLWGVSCSRTHAGVHEIQQRQQPCKLRWAPCFHGGHKQGPFLAGPGGRVPQDDVPQLWMQVPCRSCWMVLINSVLPVWCVRSNPSGAFVFRAGCTRGWLRHCIDSPCCTGFGLRFNPTALCNEPDA